MIHFTSINSSVLIKKKKPKKEFQFTGHLKNMDYTDRRIFKSLLIYHDKNCFNEKDLYTDCITPRVSTV